MLTIQVMEKFVVAFFLLTLGVASSQGIFILTIEPFEILGLIFIALFIIHIENGAKKYTKLIDNVCNIK